MHPADLDGALQLSGLAQTGGGEAQGTRLPFAVDEARLQGGEGTLRRILHLEPRDAHVGLAHRVDTAGEVLGLLVREPRLASPALAEQSYAGIRSHRRGGLIEAEVLPGPCRHGFCARRAHRVEAAHLDQRAGVCLQPRDLEALASGPRLVRPLRQALGVLLGQLEHRSVHAELAWFRVELLPHPEGNFCHQSQLCIKNRMIQGAVTLVLSLIHI